MKKAFMMFSNTPNSHYAMCIATEPGRILNILNVVFRMGFLEPRQRVTDSCHLRRRLFKCTESAKVLVSLLRRADSPELLTNF